MKIAATRASPTAYHAIRRRNEGARPSKVSSYSAALNRDASSRSMISSRASPTAISVRRVGTQLSISAQLGARTGRTPVEQGLERARQSALVHPEHGEECLLRDLDRPDPLHPLLAFLLLLEQLPLPGDIATVAIGQDVLAHGPDRFPGNDVASDRRLDRDLEHLARDQLLQAL